MKVPKGGREPGAIGESGALLSQRLPLTMPCIWLYLLKFAQSWVLRRSMDQGVITLLLFMLLRGHIQVK